MFEQVLIAHAHVFLSKQLLILDLILTEPLYRFRSNDRLSLIILCQHAEVFEQPGQATLVKTSMTVFCFMYNSSLH